MDGNVRGDLVWVGLGKFGISLVVNIRYTIKSGLDGKERHNTTTIFT